MEKTINQLPEAHYLLYLLHTRNNSSTVIIAALYNPYIFTYTYEENIF